MFSCRLENLGLEVVERERGFVSRNLIQDSITCWVSPEIVVNNPHKHSGGVPTNQYLVPYRSTAVVYYKNHLSLAFRRAKTLIIVLKSDVDNTAFGGEDTKTHFNPPPLSLFTIGHHPLMIVVISQSVGGDLFLEGF